MTDTPKAVEVNCTTGEVTERVLTAEEIAANAAAAAEQAAAQAEAEIAAQAVAAAKASAQEKLSGLGLTAEEIAALTK
jgi:hypothetical protein